jgi:hypothetical protein
MVLIVFQVLCKMSVKPRLALRFFHWAQGQSEFEPTTSTYCTLLQILSRAGLDRSVSGIMRNIVKTQCCNVLESLINEYRDEDLFPKLLDLLLWIYTKERLIEDSVALFYRMIHVGIMPSIQNCNRVLKVLRDSDHIEQARKI